MLDTKTVDGLYALKLPAMAAGLAEQRDQAAYQGLSFEERLGILVDRELTEREDRRVGRYLKAAKLRSGAVIEDIDFRRQRGNAFSRKIENHAAAVSLHFMHYNFARGHQTLTKRYGRPTTPAMAAGVTTYPWSVTQIAQLLDR